MEQLTLPGESDRGDWDAMPDRTPATYQGKARIVQFCKVDGRPFRIAPGLAKRYTVCSDKCKLERLQRPFPETKDCTGPCGRKELPIGEFYVKGKDGRPFSRCKKCCADGQREQIADLRARPIESRPDGIPDRTPAGYRSTKRVEKTCVTYLAEKGDVCGQAFLIATSIAHRYSTCSLEHSKLRSVKPIGETRVCTGPCGLEKPIDQFYRQKHRGGRPMAECKVCCDARSKRQREQNPEPYRETRRSYRRRKMLGLTREEYMALKPTLRLECTICGRLEKKRKSSLDHDHVTGAFRDVLCQRCNRILGFAQDDPELLRRLADYLDHHRESPRPRPVPLEEPVPEGQRRCPRCREPKPLEEFNGGYCNPCRTSYMRVYMRAKRLGLTVKEYEAQHPEEAA